jgi:hypothetical protein
MSFNHIAYEDVLLTVSTLAEIAILYLVYKEGSKAVTAVKEIQESTSGTIYGGTDDLEVGNRVVVLQPRPGTPREYWEYGTDVYVIREVDKLHNRALASAVLPPVQGPTPTVQGPMKGPLSPFKKLSTPG